MAHTPLFQKLQQAAAQAKEEWMKENGVEESGMTRREFLKGAALLGASAAVPSFILGSNTVHAAGAMKPSTSMGNTVIIGAGLAGLTAAYELKKSGVIAQVYEASNRLGGRCWTSRGDFADGQIAEHGGELIDQQHIEIRQLIQELGLITDNLYTAQPNGTEDFFYFDGAPYAYTDVVSDLKGIWQTLHSDLSAANYPTLYNSYTQRGWELDHMSVTDWINASVPGGMSSRLGQLLDVAYNIEYGAECTDQSSLNLIYLLGFSGQGQLRIFGPSNEKYHTTGGNDLIVQALANQVGSQVTMNSPLTAIVQNADGTYTLSLGSGGSKTTVIANRVIMAIPFSILRSAVDISQAGFSPLKLTAINNMGMGRNVKLQMQFTNRMWYNLGNNGNTYADTGYQNTWEVSRAQAGTSGILVDYTGGNIAAGLTGTATGMAPGILDKIEPVLPGLKATWNGKAIVNYWPGYQWTQGAYSYWKVGQYTQFSGMEKERQGNCFFAGEHTSIDFQGYLNGAVETGQRAANEVVADLHANGLL